MIEPFRKSHGFRGQEWETHALSVVTPEKLNMDTQCAHSERTRLVPGKITWSRMLGLDLLHLDHAAVPLDLALWQGGGEFLEGLFGHRGLLEVEVAQFGKTRKVSH